MVIFDFGSWAGLGLGWAIEDCFLFDFNGKLSPDGWDIYYITEWDYSKSTASGAKKNEPEICRSCISLKENLSFEFELEYNEPEKLNFSQREFFV